MIFLASIRYLSAVSARRCPASSMAVWMFTPATASELQNNLLDEWKSARLLPPVPSSSTGTSL